MKKYADYDRSYKLKDVIREQLDFSGDQIDGYVQNCFKTIEGFEMSDIKAYGMLGFVRFVKGFYLIIITDKSKVGTLGNHKIY